MSCLLASLVLVLSLLRITVDKTLYETQAWPLCPGLSQVRRSIRSLVVFHRCESLITITVSMSSAEPDVNSTG